MIRLTRLNGSEFYLNHSLIETIEEAPDTHLTLSNGNRYLVLEPARVIIDRIMSMQAQVLRRVTHDSSLKYLQRRNAESYRPFCRLERD
ncbi:flagellar FlbD family protein [Geobacter pelophilus]|uniref:Flagellar FlbD family protein n=1 Tax=Geoanaerobacter pelophilus TaxID=60036 RepID=A0AAW4L9U1_9BACT|nr:flagellar FlbD family protein [Geoanaerobacter pelophilus]MBT0663941.1 flagellar FlbD family protein [Geoanaerobacter pelophilus]